MINAATIPFAPEDPADWDNPPGEVKPALDELAQRVTDESGAFRIDYFLTDTASDIATYFVMQDQDTGEAESTQTLAGAGAGDDQLIAAYATLAGEPGILGLRSGVYELHTHMARTAGTRNVQAYWTLSKRAAGGTETLLMTSEVSGNITTMASVYLHAMLRDPIDMLDTDRLVMKLYVNLTALPNSATTVVVYQEGTHDCHLTINISSDILTNIFLRRDGSNDATGDLDMGGFNVDDGGTVYCDAIEGLDAVLDITGLAGTGAVHVHGGANAAGTGGQARVTGGAGSATGGAVWLYAGSGVTGGVTYLYGGNGSGGGGATWVAGGIGDGGAGGALYIMGGDGSTDGGDAYVRGGNGVGGDDGNVVIADSNTVQVDIGNGVIPINITGTVTLAGSNPDFGGLDITNVGDVDGLDCSGVEAGATADQTAGEIEAIVSHDNLLDFLGIEHQAPRGPLLFGHPGTFIGATYLRQVGGATQSDSATAKGWPQERAGSIIGFAIVYDINAVGGVGTVYAKIRRNGTTETLVSIDLDPVTAGVGNGNIITQTFTPGDHDYSAGDTIGVFIDVDGIGFTFDDVSCKLVYRDDS